MSDIVVVFLSEDTKKIEKLVSLLNDVAPTWWCKDMAHGDWEERVREAIKISKLVVPVFSENCKAPRKNILYGEVGCALDLGIPVIPFCIGKCQLSFRHDILDRVNAFGWDGSPTDPKFIELTQKIRATLSPENLSPKRLNFIRTDNVALKLPTFVYSLSSHETQLAPIDGMKILHNFTPSNILVSAYDAKKEMFVNGKSDKPGRWKKNSHFENAFKNLKNETFVTFLDSGNYEANRKREDVPYEWKKEHFWEVAKCLQADVTFSYDAYPVPKTQQQLVTKICKGFEQDFKNISLENGFICPIIHIPQKTLSTDSIGDFAADVALLVAQELSAKMIAIPERELGDGLIARMKNVRKIRKKLDSMGRYCPIHLLGTGNPISIALLAVAGADSFDGLEWCRTAVDQHGSSLYHFQHFELFRKHAYTDPKISYFVERNQYKIATLAHNFYTFNGWISSIQRLIQSGNTTEVMNKVQNACGIELNLPSLDS